MRVSSLMFGTCFWGNGGRAMGIERELTRDGTEIQPCGHYFMHSRLVLPNEQWKVVGRRCVRPSWLDGETVQLWIVRSELTGRWALVEPWQLSLVPVDDALRQMTTGRPAPPAPPPFGYPPDPTFA